ncbi:MAG: glycosyltransferase family 4 protein [Ardenticatenaceae bacterium]|nr:glycosyltransferase family 4 protein [Anaerolineales bacterium]MCB8917902.1 glycosyltransferase family 4 protein [Ardenticatenaceae bacterium]
MRILLINKFLRPVGGTETIFFNEWRWLEAAGHTVIPFGMAHPDNVASPYAEYWVPAVDYNRPTPGQLRELVWSRTAAARLAALIAATRPEAAHLHNIYHQLSPSILPVLQQANLPSLLTVHDYKLICPNYRLFTGGVPCTRCVSSHPWHALLHRCQKDSAAASALVALESSLHRRRQAYAPVDRFIVPSHFVQALLVRGGFPAGKLQIIPHAIPAPAPPAPTPPGGAPPVVLYAGRLEPEKGLDILLTAAAQLPDIPFAIAGEGSLGPAIAHELTRPALANVRLLGKLSPAGLAAARQSARLAVVPSVWYEVFGLSALEALQAGLPVVASRMGGLAEVVQHEQTGLLVPPGDAPALAAAIRQLWDDPGRAQQMGRAGQAYVQQHHRPEQYTTALLAAWQAIRGEPAATPAAA